MERMVSRMIDAIIFMVIIGAWLLCTMVDVVSGGDR